MDYVVYDTNIVCIAWLAVRSELPATEAGSAGAAHSKVNQSCTYRGS